MLLVYANGLSPRVRGNRRSACSHSHQDGSIPACAGNPARPDAQHVLYRVYPRVCGGTQRVVLPARPLSGLSPRVRGNHALERDGRVHDGSIPACAGEPAPPPAPGSPSPVYPRACAGEPAAVRSPDEYPAVYPRVCGGTARCGVQCRPPMGLSPRVRGNHREGLAGQLDKGSIPACAGKNPAVRERSIPACAGKSVCVASIVREVYPRVCGETTGRERHRLKVYPRVCGETEGLSPRVRGNQSMNPVPSWH